MGTTNYFETFIAVAPDSDAAVGVEPPAKATPTIAGRTWQLIYENPYRFTSDDVLFTVYADREGLPEAERVAIREEFFAKSRACLRASDLGTKYGWGVHADDQGRVALYGVDSAEYDSFASGQRRSADGHPVKILKAMRSRR